DLSRRRCRTPARSIAATFAGLFPNLPMSVSSVAGSSAPVNEVSESVEQALAISKRRCSELLPEADWVSKLVRSEATGVPLRIKLGLDPTAPDIHLGHTVVLNKLREPQDLGHTVIFLIGDLTSMIGDPSGRNTTRRTTCSAN